jgi:hypothetical protein
MMEVHAIIFKAAALEALDAPLHAGDELSLGGIPGFSFEITETTDGFPAAFADDDRIIGVVVGQFEDGSAAFEALEADFNLVI